MGPRVPLSPFLCRGGRRRGVPFNDHVGRPRRRRAVTGEIFAIKVAVAGNDIRGPAPSHAYAQWPMDDPYRRYDRHREDMHINSRTRVAVVQTSRSCLARISRCRRSHCYGRRVVGSEIDGRGWLWILYPSRSAMKNDRDQMARSF